MDNIIFEVTHRAVSGGEAGIIVTHSTHADSYSEAQSISRKALAEREGYNPDEWVYCDIDVKYEVTAEQYKKLEGLASWIASASNFRERYGKPFAQAENTIKNLLTECDELKIPFYVQNAVIEFGRSWRRYEAEYLSGILEVVK